MVELCKEDLSHWCDGREEAACLCCNELKKGAVKKRTQYRGSFKCTQISFKHCRIAPKRRRRIGEAQKSRRQKRGGEVAAS